MSLMCYRIWIWLKHKCSIPMEKKLWLKSKNFFNSSENRLIVDGKTRVISTLIYELAMINLASASFFFRIAIIDREVTFMIDWILAKSESVHHRTKTHNHHQQNITEEKKINLIVFCDDIKTKRKLTLSIICCEIRNKFINYFVWQKILQFNWCDRATNLHRSVVHVSWQRLYRLMVLKLARQSQWNWARKWWVKCGTTVPKSINKASSQCDTLATAMPPWLLFTCTELRFLWTNTEDSKRVKKNLR